MTEPLAPVLITTVAEPVPSRTQPGTFSTDMDALLGKFPAIFSEMNASTTNVSANAVSARDKAVIATEQATIATTQAELATTNGATQVNLATAQAVIAGEYADNAASSAQTALLAPGTSATSSTAIEISTGLKTFTIQTGKLFVPGMTMKAEHEGQWMLGDVSSHNSETGEIVLNVGFIFGVGTFDTWNMSLAATTDIPGNLYLYSFNNFI